MPNEESLMFKYPFLTCRRRHHLAPSQHCQTLSVK